MFSKEIQAQLDHLKARPLSQAGRSMLNNMVVLTRNSPAYRLDFEDWLRYGSTLMLRDKLAKPLEPLEPSPVNSPAYLAHFNAWAELDTEGMHARDTFQQEIGK